MANVIVCSGFILLAGNDTISTCNNIDVMSLHCTSRLVSCHSDVEMRASSYQI